MSQTWRLLVGDVREQLRLLPEASVHCVVTSPPYWGLRDYGLPPSVWGGDASCAHEWGPNVTLHKGGPHGNGVMVRGGRAIIDAQAATKTIDAGAFCARCGAWFGCLGLEPTPYLFVEHVVDVFREVRRVLRPDGVCFLNLGDSYATGAGAVGNSPGGGSQGARWRGAGPHKSRHYGEDRPHVGPMTQPNRLPIPGLKPKDLCMVPHRAAIALQADGWWVRADIVWSKPNPMPESVEDRTTKAHEYLFLLAKSEQYFYDAEAIREAAERPEGAGNTRPYQVAGERPGANANKGGSLHKIGPRSTRNKRSVWTITTQPYPDAHFATFPEELPETCIKAGTSERGACSACGAPFERIVELGEPLRDQQEASGGNADGEYFGQAVKDYDGTGAQNPSDVKRRILEGMRERHTVGWRPTCDCGAGVVPCVVCDPFTGSGTTGVVALRLGRSFVGSELNPTYADRLARPRLAAVAPLLATEVPA